MTRKQKLTPLAIAIGAVAITITAPQEASAQEDPFVMKELSSGYMIADSHKKKEKKDGEGKCGEGKCGEGKCGEGKCGEGKCGEGKDGKSKDGEGKCGEGTCGN